MDKEVGANEMKLLGLASALLIVTFLFVGWTFVPATVVVPSFDNTKSLFLGATNTNKQVNFGNNLTLEYNNPWSICFWTKPGNNPGDGLIFAKENEASPYTGYDLRFNAANKFELFYSNTYPTNVLDTASTAQSQGSWYFVCWTSTGTGANSGMRLYINGTVQTPTVVSSRDTLSASTANAKNAYVSGYQSGAVYSGYINQVFMTIGYAMSQSNVNEAYATTHPIDISSSTFVAHVTNWWYFNQADSASTITDHVGSVNGTGVNLSSGDFVSDVP